MSGDEPTYPGSERTQTALNRVSDLASKYEDQSGTLEFYGSATVEALSEYRASVKGDIDYRDLLADVDPVATTSLEKVHQRHIDAVDTVRRVHDAHENVITVVVPEPREGDE